MKNGVSKTNLHDSRESWLRAAARELTPYFKTCGLSIPENIRFAIAFPSTGRQGRRVGECWHCSTSEDGNYEIIIRADIADPVEVLGVLVHELIHAVLPADAGHGKLYREAAVKVGLEGKMRHAMPSQLLRPRLEALAESLGSLPHARLNIERGRDNKPADRPKKQKARLLKAECEGDGCGYTVRITAKWVDEIGAPLCPKHGAMRVERGDDDEETGEAAGEVEAERESV
jgi:hypothetical protein